MNKIDYNGTADVYVTERCNMNCIFCSARKNELDISLANFKKYVDNWVHYGINHINVTGGEPLLHPAISELLEYAHGAGMEVALFTNASLLSDTMCDKTVPYIKWLAVSIDGNDYDNYSLGRSKNQMIHSVATLKKIRMDYPDVLMRVATIVTSKNEEGIYELGRYMLENEFTPDLWRIKQLIPVRRAAENWNALAVSDTAYQQVVSKIMSQFGATINVRANGWKSKSGDLIVTYPDGESGVTIIKDTGTDGTVVNLGNIFLNFDKVLQNWERAINADKWASNNYKEEAWGTQTINATSQSDQGRDASHWYPTIITG